MKYLLFTTTTCPNCPALKEFVAENISFGGEVLDDSSPNFGERIREAGVQNAPTLIVFDDEGAEVFRGGEVSEVADFLGGPG
ncbi:MAG: thioredoxin family protein [Patescibacteria group bacterium]